jgi:hypothetical protein
MPETTAPTSAVPEFVDLVCADLALLHAEFEAIVAANFLTPPPIDRLPRGESGPPMRVPAGLAWLGVNYRDAGDTAHAINAAHRQRSPPVLTSPFAMQFRADHDRDRTAERQVMLSIRLRRLPAVLCNGYGGQQPGASRLAMMPVACQQVCGSAYGMGWIVLIVQHVLGCPTAVPPSLRDHD